MSNEIPNGTPEKVWLEFDSTNGSGTPYNPYWHETQRYKSDVEYIRADLCEPQWVSVAERLPEHNQQVWAYSPNFPASEARFVILDDGAWFMAFYRTPLQNVTHWMPRLTPAPPSEAMPQGETDANK